MTRRAITFAVVLLGAVSGMAIGGCLDQGACDLSAAPPLISTSLIRTHGDAWGGDPVDDDLRVDVDLESATVTVRYASDGAAVERVYRIASTREGLYL